MNTNIEKLTQNGVNFIHSIVNLFTFVLNTRGNSPVPYMWKTKIKENVKYVFSSNVKTF